MREQLALPDVTRAEHRCPICRALIPPRRVPGRYCSSRCRLDAWAVARAAEVASSKALTPTREAQAGGLPLSPAQGRAGVLRSFHVRSHQTVGEALAGEAKARLQDEAILEFFRVRDLCADRRWTPSEVHAEFPQFLLTSVRRSLTTMTRRGLLVHHPEDRRPGPYGVKESTWSLRV